jgi:hypothetical protein
MLLLLSDTGYVLIKVSLPRIINQGHSKFDRKNKLDMNLNVCIRHFRDSYHSKMVTRFQTFTKRVIFQP